MSVYQIQTLNGYTDGKPSWRKVFCGRLPDKEAADMEIERLRTANPKVTYRVVRRARRR